ncbi:MAG: hypothetical protein Q8Q09_11070 [Deltaproteobacteria bacterium]|nr:hypothetical protein [Deltaproteobacteria bacterium]
MKRVAVVLNVCVVAALCACGAPEPSRDVVVTDDARVVEDRPLPVDAEIVLADSSLSIDATVPVDDSGVAADGAADGAAADARGADRVGVFVAQGMMGRTTVSCDDGRTWIANRSDNDAIRCFTSMVDCDHNGGRAMGVTAIDGAFVATWGWGEANSVRRSVDGMRWDRVLDRTVFSGITSDAVTGTVVAVHNAPRVSTNGGALFGAPETAMGFRGHIRKVGRGAGALARFVAAGGENGATDGDVMFSANGAQWRRGTSVPSVCGQGVAGIGASETLTVITHGSGLVCVSSDSGERWTSAMVPGMTFESNVLWLGTEFVSWGRTMAGGVIARSPDGLRWTTTVLSARNSDGSRATTPRVNTVARSSAGTMVTVHGEWQQWYAMQKFYRSTDGVTWDALPASAFVGSHPISHIAYGTLARGGVCP